MNSSRSSVSVERRTVNPKVESSSLSGSEFYIYLKEFKIKNKKIIYIIHYIIIIILFR